MKNARKIIPVLLALVGILAGFSLKALAESVDSLNDRESVDRAMALVHISGQKFKEYLDRGIYNDKELARVISEMLTMLGDERSEERILDSLGRRRAVFHEAKRLGFYVTDQEFNEEFNDIQTIMRQSGAYPAILAFCAGAEIAENEFWRLRSLFYKEGRTRGKLFQTLYEKFWVDNQDKYSHEFNELHDAYMKNYVDELKREYDQGDDKDSGSAEDSAVQMLEFLFGAF